METSCSNIVVCRENKQQNQNKAKPKPPGVCVCVFVWVWVVFCLFGGVFLVVVVVGFCLYFFSFNLENLIYIVWHFQNVKFCLLQYCRQDMELSIGIKLVGGETL